MVFQCTVLPPSSSSSGVKFLTPSLVQTQGSENAGAKTSRQRNPCSSQKDVREVNEKPTRERRKSRSFFREARELAAGVLVIKKKKKTLRPR